MMAQKVCAAFMQSEVWFNQKDGTMLVLRVLWLGLLCFGATAVLQAEDLVKTGTANQRLVSFDNVMVDFVTKNSLPGAALAVGREGKLFYERGYGWADVEQQQPVQPTSLFRIASISKPVTGVAILKLCQDGRLKLEDKAFDLLKLEPHLSLETKADPLLADITIRQLLQHTSGWDRDQSFDPMFRSIGIAESLMVPAPAKPEHVIRYMLGRPLDFAPGQRYAYSNFGYCVLGRVIEKVSGQSYEEYVQTSILKPLGITTMKIGRTRLAERAANEGRYYSKKPQDGPSVFADDLGKPVPHPYGAWYLEAMDSHGGWIASASDLVKFAMQFDLPPQKRLLNEDSIKVMMQRPEGRAGHDDKGLPSPFYYGCGWSVRPLNDSREANIWHNGSLPGTSTIVVRRGRDKLCWAVLFNSRDTNPPPSSQIDPLMHSAANLVKEWPAD